MTKIKKAGLVVLGLGAGASIAWCVTVLMERDEVRPRDVASSASGATKSRQEHTRRSWRSEGPERSTRPKGEFAIPVDRGEEGEPDSSPPRDAVASKKQREADFVALIEEHERERLDPAWSHVFTEAVNADLNALADRFGFRTERVSCRSETCVATLAWPNFGRAMKGWQGVLLASGAVPCATQILLPDAVDPDQEFSHQVVYTRCAGDLTVHE